MKTKFVHAPPHICVEGISFDVMLTKPLHNGIFFVFRETWDGTSVSSSVSESNVVVRTAVPV